MTFYRLLVLTACGMLLGGRLGLCADDGDARQDAIIEAFLAASELHRDFSPEQLQKAKEVVATLRAGADSKPLAITEALRELYPEFRSALVALGEENLGVAIGVLTRLQTHADPYLQADAGYFLARGYLLDERFEEALPLLSELTGKAADKTLRGGEALFLQGVAEIQLLKHQEATQSLTTFLARYPAAPERMRVGALRQLEQLKAYQAGTLSDVQLRMDYSRRRLSLEDTGQATRQQQGKISEILAKLIQEAEERESNAKGAGQGSGQGKAQGQGGEGDSQASGDGKGGQNGNSGGGEPRRRWRFGQAVASGRATKSLEPTSR